MTAVDAEPPTGSAERLPASRPVGVYRFLGRLHEVLDTVDMDRLWTLSPAELAESLTEAYAAQARLAALTLALVAEADRGDLAAHEGAANLIAWLRDRVRLAPGEGKRQVALARMLDEYPVTRAALAAGGFPVASALVITKVLEALPDEVAPETRVRAEEYLAGEAHVHDTQALQRLAEHLDEVVDPEGADARLADQLARAEAQAAREVFLDLRHDQATATSHGLFRLPLVSGVKLERMIQALLNPGRPGPIPTQDPATGIRLRAGERRGHALVELVDRVPEGRLPQTGGCEPTVVVTMELATLTGGLHAARLDTGHMLSPGRARRLAAQCGVIPAVLGTSSEVLDLGRKARLFTRRQRLAMNLQQHGTCAVQDCDRPATWGDAHHLTPWRAGGPTDLANGVLICKRHHTYADHPHYQVDQPRPGHIHIHRRQ